MSAKFIVPRCTSRAPAFAGVDPIGHITSANLRRRNMTKGQTAIVVMRASKESVNRGGDLERQDVTLQKIADVIDISAARTLVVERQCAARAGDRRDWNA